MHPIKVIFIELERDFIFVETNSVAANIQQNKSLYFYFLKLNLNK